MRLGQESRSIQFQSIARRATREDPSSGLRVDLGPAAVLAADDEETAAANNREARLAAGSPTDPLRPDATLNLDDSDATKDLWARVRQGFQLPPLEDELVGQHERYYASRPEYVQRMTGRPAGVAWMIAAAVVVCWKRQPVITIISGCGWMPGFFRPVGWISRFGGFAEMTMCNLV